MSPPLLSDRVYRLLLKLLPRELREESGEEMSELFSEYRKIWSGRRGGALRLWSVALRDILVQATMARFERTARADSSERWTPERGRGGGIGLASPIQDLRHAVRNLKRRPGLPAIVVMTLAVGIGANTALFSVIRGVLLRPLPYTDPGRLVRVAESGMDEVGLRQTSMPNFMDWEQSDVFEDLAAYFGGPMILTGQEFPERLVVKRVTPNVFSVLGVQPALGRVFRPEEGARRDHVVILNHGFWQRAFGSDPDVIGRQITLSDEPYTVIGVLGPDVGLSALTPFNAPILRPFPAAPRDLWRRRVRFLQAVGRLAPGVTMERASAVMSELGLRLAEEYPEANEGRTVVVVPVLEAHLGEVRTPLLLLMGAVGSLLILACCNVASMLLARAVSRGPELAIRAALGAGRGRLVREALVESLLLGALGGGLGLALAWALHAVLLTVAPADIPRLEGVGLDGMALLFTGGLALGSGVLFGLAPAVSAARGTGLPGASIGSRWSTGRARPFRILVTVQATLALALVFGGGLVGMSFARLVTVDPGYDPAGVFVMRMALPSSRYPTPDARVRFQRRLLQEVEAIPGVEHAATAALPVLATGGFGVDIDLNDGTVPLAGGVWRVSSDYFRTLRMDLIAGRHFRSGDNLEGQPVVIVGQGTARRLFGDADPLGRTLTLGTHLKTDEVPRVVVGIVNEFRAYGLDQEPYNQVYIPHEQWSGGTVNLTVRATDDPARLAPALRSLVAGLDPALPIDRFSTLERTLSVSVSERRFYSLLLAVLAGVALLLTGSGIFGVLSFAVSRRFREVGVRVALGARPSGIFGLLLRAGMGPVSIGAALGLLASAGASRFLQSQLFGVTIQDAGTVAVLGTLVVLSVALAACVAPAMRATRVDPVEVLGAE